MTLFAANMVVALGLGAVRGFSFRIWRRGARDAMMQGTPLTLALWVASIAARVAIGAAMRSPIQLDELPVFLAVTFAPQNLVVWARVQSLIGALMEVR